MSSVLEPSPEICSALLLPPPPPPQPAAAKASKTSTPRSAAPWSPRFKVLLMLLLLFPRLDCERVLWAPREAHPPTTGFEGLARGRFEVLSDHYQRSTVVELHCVARDHADVHDVADLPGLDVGS